MLLDVRRAQVYFLVRSARFGASSKVQPSQDTVVKSDNMAAATVRTRILIISDTHTATLTADDASSPFSLPLPAVDLLIHCGDLTHTGRYDEYERTLDMLLAINAPVKLVIAGNHDLTLDRDFVLGHLGQHGPSEEDARLKWRKARDLWTSPDGRARLEGVTFLDEGLHDVSLANGAHVKVYASPYTPEFYDWGFPYEIYEDRFNGPQHSLTDARNIATCPIPSYSSNDALDILVTHGPPLGLLDMTNRGTSAGCLHLLRAVMRSRPLIHCFGHIHEGMGTGRVEWAKHVDALVASEVSTSQWVSDESCGWKAGLAMFSEQPSASRQEYAACLNLSMDGGRPIRRGEETVMINAAIMDRHI